MRTLLNALTSLGLLRKHDDQYANTPETSRFFTQDSKDNHRNGMLHTANIWHRWSTLTDAVRTGKAMPVQRAETRGWTANFIAGMQRNAKLRAPLVVKQLGTLGIRRVLDLGGGSGAYSIAFAKSSPEIHCDIIDLPEVVAITDDYIQKAGASKQVAVHPGDMLTAELGSGYDLVMLNAICHMFSEDQNLALFRRAHAALAPGGRLAMQDFILNPNHASPQHAALFAINMLVATESGATYTEAEYTAWVKAAGFSNVSRQTLPGPSDLIVGTK
jgi:predicted O-methyltransferase YrrM